MRGALGLLCALAAVAAAEPAPDLAHGRAVYEESCAPCHGERGDGRGPAARWLSPRPRDFTRGVFQLRSTASGQLPTDADLIAVVERGMPGTSMPGWRHQLAPADIRAVVAYLQRFSPRFAQPRAARPLPPVPADTAALAGEGRALYRLLRCWDCHGPGGRGDGPSAATTKDDQGRRMRPRDLTTRLRAGDDAAAVYRVIDGGMDGTPMPAYASAILLSREALSDLGPLTAVFGAAAVADLRRFVAVQPREAALEALDDGALAALTARRLWALAIYVRSLRSRGLGEYLFGDQVGRYAVP